MSEIDYAARVAKGVALLDEKRPGWERLIDLEILDIENGGRCVTAQISGMKHGPESWLDGMELLKLTGGIHGSYMAHGFNAEHPSEFEDSGGDVPDGYEQDAAYAALNRLWRETVQDRLSVGEQPAQG